MRDCVLDRRIRQRSLVRWHLSFDFLCHPQDLRLALFLRFRIGDGLAPQILSNPRVGDAS